MKKEYDYVISLGEKCFITQSLIKLNLRKASGPFDWTGSFAPGAGLSTRLQLILDDFSDFITKDLMKPEYDFDGRRLFINTKTKMAFRHEFEQEDDFDTKYPEILEKYNRRIKRFNEILASGKRILFVYASSLYENSDANDTVKKIELIQKKFKNPNISILVIDSDNTLNKKNKIKFKHINSNVQWVSGCDLHKPVEVTTSEYYVGVMLNILNQVIKPYKPKLIVSLTSYPARINTVHLVIESLINQTKQADKIILWLNPEQFPNGEADLPKNLRDLTEQGLTIDWYHNIRSYTKLIPTLRKYPNDLILTVDDDIIYKPTMIEKLYKSYLKYPNDINAHRVTKFIYKKDKFKTIGGGKYWHRGAHPLNKLTGVGGVLYPQRCFHPDIFNEDLFKKLAPTNDDHWFWLQAVRNNVCVRVIKDNEPELNYTPGSQDVGLYLVNDHGDNLFWADFNRMMEHYPDLHRKLKRAGIRAHWFFKERDGIHRRFYLFGWRILSYKKKSEIKLSDLNERELPQALWKKFCERTGKKPTDNLVTLNEKIIWASMFDVTDLKVQCADKIAVRDYVAKTVGDKYLPELYAMYKKSDDFDLQNLPDRFVLTYNRGANNEHTILVNDKNKLDLADTQSKIAQWMRFDMSDIWGEMQYRYIKPCVMARELLDIRTDIEYKLWCFGGKCEFVCLNSYVRGHGSVGQAVYDTKWKKQEFYQSDGDGWMIPETIKKPKFLDEMIAVAEKLAAPFDFVRVDFYETTDGELKFGELTFSPTAGNIEWTPDNDAIQKKYGALFKIPPRDKRGYAICKK